MRNTTLLLISIISSVQAVTTVTEDFADGNGGFITLNNTTITTPGNGNLEFTSTNGQGSGVSLDFANDFSNDLTQPLFFQFTTIVPPTSGADEEIGFFFGPSVNQAQSGSITTGQNTNAFTFFINDQEVFAPDNSQGTAFTGTGNGQSVSLLSGLGVGSIVTFNVEWTPTPAQNGGQFNNTFTLNVDGFDSNGFAVSASETLDGAQNINGSSINDFVFTAATTTNLTASIDDFTVSDMPIPVPEPSSILLSLFSVPLLLRRRRHA